MADGRRPAVPSRRLAGPAIAARPPPAAPAAQQAAHLADLIAAWAMGRPDRTPARRDPPFGARLVRWMAEVAIVSAAWAMGRPSAAPGAATVNEGGVRSSHACRPDPCPVR